MKIDFYGDPTPIGWNALGIKLPFAPTWELAKKYEPELKPILTNRPLLDIISPQLLQGIRNAFDNPQLPFEVTHTLYTRAQRFRTYIQQAVNDSHSRASVVLGGGFHHAEVFGTPYAYCIINDLYAAAAIAKGRTLIVDIDYHFGGGTIASIIKYGNDIHVIDYHNSEGVLYNHKQTADASIADARFHLSNTPDKLLMHVQYLDISCFQNIIVNCGADLSEHDSTFNGGLSDEQLLKVWQAPIQKALEANKKVTITLGGGYGPHAITLWQELIDWLLAYDLKVCLDA